MVSFTRGLIFERELVSSCNMSPTLISWAISPDWIPEVDLLPQSELDDDTLLQVGVIIKRSKKNGQNRHKTVPLYL